MENPPTIESEKESVPTLKEVLTFIEGELGREGYTIDRQLEDEEGLYLLDIQYPHKGGTVEFSYVRSGKYEEGSSPKTQIDIFYYDADGIPKDGDNFAVYENGQWRKKV